MSEAIRITYPDLPVSRERERIMDLMRKHQVLVVVGDTGSGKTTQLPKMALEIAREQRRAGRIGCTQPRRLATASVARRVAEELQCELGGTVGYQVRFEDQSVVATELKFMTDGILLAEKQGDPELRQYSTLIIDEAHERSLNIDFILGYLKRLLPKRPDLQLIISSATLDAESFSAFFDQAPVIQVEGRTYPVETYHLAPEEDEDLAPLVLRGVKWLSEVDREGDVLIFLPGEREIREVAEVLEGAKLSQTEILPLYARLSLSDQQRVFTTIKGKRRVVLATNVAETSLTIPGIVYVIDSGLARVSRWIPNRGVQSLQIEAISQASANQRKGRCGRVSEGICLRLYPEDDFELRAEFTDPEIRRSSLAGVILRMKALDLPDIEEFPFLNPPGGRQISEGYRTLQDIGALDEERRLTRIGRQLARFPLDPPHSRMLLAAHRDEQCLAEMLVIVAAMSIMDPRERPADKKAEADQAHAKWRDVESDFRSVLKIWVELGEYRDGGNWKRNQLRRYCQKSYLNYRRVIEWDQLHRDLKRHAKEQFKWKPSEVPLEMTEWPTLARLHCAILAGLPRGFGVFDREQRAYRGPAGRLFAIFPGSNLFAAKKKPEWVLATELVETSRLWARKVGKIESAWIEQVAPHLCSSHYYDAHFDAQQGVVFAKERVMCGGLRIVEGRRVHYGRVEPEKAREIFIKEGLLADGLKNRPAFLRHLDELREEVVRMEMKLRRKGSLWNEAGVYEFFDRLLPQDLHSAKAFHDWRKKFEAKEAKGLFIDIQEVVYETINDLPLAGFPDEIGVLGETYSVYYQYAPGEVDDGVTLGIHIDQLSDFPDWLLEWGVPGQLALRADTWIRSLPKESRVRCQPIPSAADAFAELWKRREPSGSFGFQLAEFLSEWTSSLIREEEFQPERLPEELLTKCWIADDEGNELGFGKNLAELRNSLSPLIVQRFEEQAAERWESSGHREWDFGELPERVEIGSQTGWPALTDEGESVGIKVYAQAAAAERSHRAGILRLLHLHHGDAIQYLRKKLPLPFDVKLYLPLLGAAGERNFEDLIGLCLEGAMGQPMPRDGENYSKKAHQMRGELMLIAEKLAKILAEIINCYRQLGEFFEAERKHRYHAPIVADMEAQLDYLLRPGFLQVAGYHRFMEYPRYFKGMLERIERLRSLPYLRDLEKYQQLEPYLQEWVEASAVLADSEEVENLGWMLQEWRISLFAPKLPVPIKISEKRIAELCDQLAN